MDNATKKADAEKKSAVDEQAAKEAALDKRLTEMRNANKLKAEDGP